MGVLLGFVIGIAGLLLVCFLAWACLNWVLGPLDRAARNRQFPIQFGLADLLCLFVLVQLPVGTLHWAMHDVLKEGILVLDVVLGVVAALVWWVCVRTLSRAGIHEVWQRAIVLTFVLPSGYVGSGAVLVLPFATVGLFLAQHTLSAGWLLLLEIPLIGILYGLGRVTRAVVASTKETAAEWREE
jgi:hypothetical protein